MRGDEWSGERSDTMRIRKREDMSDEKRWLKWRLRRMREREGKEMVGMKIEEKGEERR